MLCDALDRRSAFGPLCLLLAFSFAFVPSMAFAQLLPGDLVLLQQDRIIAVQPTGGPVRTISSAEVGSIDRVIFDAHSGRQILFPELSSFTVSPEGILYATGAGIVWRIDGRTGDRVAVSSSNSPGTIDSFGADFAVELAGEGRLIVASLSHTVATSHQGPIQVRVIEVDPLTGFKTLLQFFPSNAQRGRIADFERLSDGRILAATSLHDASAFLYDPDFATAFIRPAGPFDDTADITPTPSDGNRVYAIITGRQIALKTHLVPSGTVPLSFTGLPSATAVALSDQDQLFALGGSPLRIYRLDPVAMTATAPIDLGFQRRDTVIEMRVAPGVFEGGEDTDGDGFTDVFDNCALIPNEDQADTDGDRVGDACNDAYDLDGDEYRDTLDICPTNFDPDQADFDGDGVGDACNDAIDADGDEVADDLDLCPDDDDPFQTDTDGDGIGDACDPYPGEVNHELAFLREEVDSLATELEECRVNPPIPNDFDSDGIRDAIDECPDTLLGEPVGFAGCSLDQFCNRFGPLASNLDRKTCANADWLGIAPPGKARYCRPRGVKCIPRYEPASLSR